MDLRLDGTSFSVQAPSYRFAFDGASGTGTLSDARGQRVASIAFGPGLDGAPADLSVRSLSQRGQSLVVTGTSGEKELELELSFHDRGLCYVYRSNGQFGELTSARLEGSFQRLENFDPDLERVDIPERVGLRFQISSRRPSASQFFELDQGAYVIPPYLFGIGSTSGGLIGCGLCEVPSLHAPIDAELTTAHACLKFDYRTSVGSASASPSVCVWIAETRRELLDGYREILAAARAVTEPSGGAPPLPAAYTTFGDQVYAKHLAEGTFATEAGAEKTLTSRLVNGALAELEQRGLRPGLLVIDEGWSKQVGSLEPDDARFGGSLAQFIRDKKRLGHQVILHVNPFLVAPPSDGAAEPGELVLAASGEPVRVSRGSRDYCLRDLSAPSAREKLARALAGLTDPNGLGADGIKLVGTKYLPPGDARPANPAYGVGEAYLLSACRDVSAAVKQGNPAAIVTLACLNPLFGSCFDVMRMGNTSEVNHDLHVLRAATASRLMPHKPIDTDDWAAYGKVLGATTFIKVVAGSPNLFSAFYRGDGRLRFQGAMGGHPMALTDEQYRVLSAAWTLHEKSQGIVRGKLAIDYDRMEFSSERRNGAPFVRTFHGGNVLAVFLEREAWLASLLDEPVVLELPAGFELTSIERVDRSGAREQVAFRRCLSNKVLLNVRSSREDTLVYHLQGA
jgi:hypothetical protein